MRKRNELGTMAPPHISRRNLLAAGAAFSLAQVLSDPGLAADVAAGLETVTIKTPSGREVSAAWAAPAAATAPALMLVHEFWGLNDQIKSVAAELARLGYGALAIDLYGGKAAANSEPDRARALMAAVKNDEASETCTAWIDRLRASPRVKGGVATCGWCYGGGWSLAASILRPVEATVVYYGNVTRTAHELRNLEGPVLGHFANRDNWINHPMVEGFKREMKAVRKEYEIYWYDADHAFANPTTARYDAADAKLAWSRTLAFLKRELG